VGQQQGFVDDPDHCHFDPAVLLCKNGDAPDCLTAPQLDLLRKLYAGPVNPRTGESIFPGMPVGGELQWAQDQGGAKPIGVAVDLYKYAVYQDANWDWKTMDYDRAIAKAVKETDPVLYADPNLTEFLKQGGKLMMYIGASEYHSFLDMESYYNTVMKNAGAAKKDQVRLFVVDGMGHCGGGAGADTFEKLGTIDQWVETGKAPDQLPSSKMSQGKVAFSRPLCAYPGVARYKGTGDINDAANFTCAK
jgi:feruloyl esterase